MTTCELDLGELDSEYLKHQEFLESLEYTPEEYEWLLGCLDEEEENSSSADELSDEEYQRILEELYLKDGPLDIMFELLADPVVAKCGYRVFVSRTKGRSRGRGRKPRCTSKLRKAWTEVELVHYCGHHYWLREDGYGPFDGIATEVLGPTVEPENAERELLNRLRTLPRIRKDLKEAKRQIGRNGNNDRKNGVGLAD